MNAAEVSERRTFTGVVIREDMNDAVVWALCGDQAVIRCNTIPAATWIKFEVAELDFFLIGEIGWEAYNVETIEPLLLTKTLESTVVCDGYMRVASTSQAIEGFRRASNSLLGTVWLPDDPGVLNDASRYVISLDDNGTALLEASLIFDEEQNGWIAAALTYKADDEWKLHTLSGLPNNLASLAATLSAGHETEDHERISPTASSDDAGYGSLSGESSAEAALETSSTSPVDEDALSLAAPLCFEKFCLQNPTVDTSTQTTAYSFMDLNAEIEKLMQAEVASSAAQSRLPASVGSKR